MSPERIKAMTGVQSMIRKKVGLAFGNGHAGGQKGPEDVPFASNNGHPADVA
jgi:hypothetical protein